jgi:hypothetical protein
MNPVSDKPEIQSTKYETLALKKGYILPTEKIIIGLSGHGYLFQKGRNTNSSEIVERPRDLIQEHGAGR